MRTPAIADVVLRQRCTVEGWVIDVTAYEYPWVRLDVDITDGSALLVLRFMGRREVPGIDPGRRVRADGTPAEAHGQRVILNPSYSFLTCRTS